MKVIDYGAMSSRELLSLAFDAHYHCVDGGPSYDEWRDAIESALRSAVIREASVGAVYVARNAPHECPEFRFKCPENLTGLSGNDMCQLCGELLPEHQYLLISKPKETP